MAVFKPFNFLRVALLSRRRYKKLKTAAALLTPPHPPLIQNDQLGNELEHHGIREADLRAWCEATGMLRDVRVERISFRKEEGEDASFGTGREFQMLAMSCVRKVEGGAARAARLSAGEW